MDGRRETGARVVGPKSTPTARSVRYDPLDTRKPAQMPAKPPSIPSVTGHNEKGSAPQRLGNQPPRADPAIMPMVMSAFRFTVGG